MSRIERRGLVFAAVYGATTVTLAYFIAHGSLVVFLAVLIGIGLAARFWAIWYRRRRGLPPRRNTRRRDESR